MSRLFLNIRTASNEFDLASRRTCNLGRHFLGVASSSSLCYFASATNDRALWAIIGARASWLLRLGWRTRRAAAKGRTTWGLDTATSARLGRFAGLARLGGLVISTCRLGIRPIIVSRIPLDKLDLCTSSGNTTFTWRWVVTCKRAPARLSAFRGRLVSPWFWRLMRQFGRITLLVSLDGTSLRCR
jgi:hypothetical protein